MLLRNVQAANSHVNSARYIVDSMMNNVLFMLSVSERCNGNHLLLPIIPCDSGNEIFSLPGFSRNQFPVRVCLANTTNNAH